jgi:hypothetical protein
MKRSAMLLVLLASCMSTQEASLGARGSRSARDSGPTPRQEDEREDTDSPQVSDAGVSQLDASEALDAALNADGGSSTDAASHDARFDAAVDAHGSHEEEEGEEGNESHHH